MNAWTSSVQLMSVPIRWIHVVGCTRHTAVKIGAHMICHMLLAGLALNLWSSFHTQHVHPRARSKVYCTLHGLQECKCYMNSARSIINIKIITKCVCQSPINLNFVPVALLNLLIIHLSSCRFSFFEVFRCCFFYFYRMFSCLIRII
mgnify:CR=1 FL=1